MSFTNSDSRFNTYVAPLGWEFQSNEVENAFTVKSLTTFNYNLQQLSDFYFDEVYSSSGAKLDSSIFPQNMYLLYFILPIKSNNGSAIPTPSLVESIFNSIVSSTRVQYDYYFSSLGQISSNSYLYRFIHDLAF